MENKEETILEENNSQEENNLKEENTSKEDFNKIINDLLNDIKTTFPEYQDDIVKYYDENENIDFDYLYKYCKEYYPKKFFHIINSDDEIMKDDENNEFLPNFNFSKLWIDDVTDNTKEAIWKYLKLILFNIIENTQDKNIFGDAAKLFEAIDGDLLKEKMQETMKGLQEMFLNNDDNEEDEDNDEKNDDKKPDFLNPENIQESISKLLDGKLGKLATEIAEETANEMGVDIENPDNAESLNDIMKNMIGNPSKIMDLVKKVGGKLQDKIEKGEIKESELLAEAGDLMKNMKKMPGAKDINKMMKNMGMDLGSLGSLAGLGGLGGKGGKFNTGAMKSHLKKKQMQERIREKAINKVKQRELEEKRIQEEYELKSKEFLKDKDIVEDKSIDDLLKELNIENENTQEQPNKKKKKKSKK